MALEKVWSSWEYLEANWEAESYPAVSDLRFIVIFTIFFPLVRFVLDSFIFEKVGRYYIFRKARELAAAGVPTRPPAAGAAAAAKDEDRKQLISGAPSHSQPEGEPDGAGSLGRGRPAVNGQAGPSKEDPGTVAAAGVGAPGEQLAGGADTAVASVESIDRAALEKVHIKFKESCWKSLYYFSAELFSLSISLGEPWMQDTIYFWIGPGDLRWPDQTMKLKLKTLYMYIGGFYMYSIFALIFWETRRKDFSVSMTHHVATVALIIGSYLFRFGRVCSIVVAIHDASDIFLELAKLSRYLNAEGAASVMFVTFAISWPVLRLYCFPRFVIYSACYKVLQVLDKRDHLRQGPVLYYTFNFLLILLLVLHVYWWILIVRVLWKQISHGTIEKDVRSEDEDEGGDDADT